MADMLDRLGQTQRDQVMKVLEGIAQAPGNESNVYNIEMEFKSKLFPDTKLKFSREIEYVRITQDFINKISDKIMTELMLDKQDYIALYNMRRDLFCELTFTHFDPQQSVKKADTTPEFRATYRAIILDNADIFKHITSDKLNGGKENNVEGDKDQVTLKMRIELIDDTFYKSRKKRINFISRGCTMMDILRYTVNFFGFKQARIFQPDNENVYTNFVVPPDFGVSNIMGFLQNGPSMGVYDSGFCSYITQGCWYVFPRFGDFFTKRVVQVYSLGTITALSALRRFNWNENVDGGDDFVCHIILDGDVKETNLSALGSENKPNAANILLDEATIDSCREVTADGEFTMEPMIYNPASAATDPMDEDEPINLEFRHSHGNVHTIKSELCAYQTTLIEFDWRYCSPFIFHPNTEVRYNYVHQNGYKTIPGKCEAAEYVFIRDKSYSQYPIFAGDCHVTMCCNNTLAIEHGCV